MKWTRILCAALFLSACGSGDSNAPLGPSSGVEEREVAVLVGGQTEPLVGPIQQFSRTNDEGIVVEEYQYFFDGSRRVVDGLYRSYWDNGNRREAGAFEHNHKNGDWSYYDETGDLMVSSEVWKSGTTLRRMTYYENGVMRSETHFFADGDFSIYYFENGNKEREGAYRDGLEIGLWIWYYENGNKKEEGNFRDGKWDGAWVWYRADGTMQYERSYWNGIERGIWSWWDEHGHKTRQEIWQDGRLIEKINCVQTPTTCGPG